MAIKTKASIKKEAPAAKRYRLRLRHWMMFWILVALTIILIMTIFGDVDEKMAAVNGSADVDLGQIAQLKSELQAKVDNFDQQNRAAKNQPVFAGRIELTEEMRSTSNAVFCGDLSENNNDPQKQTFTYTDIDTGVSFLVPYNDAWGYEHCYLSHVWNQTDTDTNGSRFSWLRFGPPVAAEREFEMTIDKAVTESAFIREWNKNLEAAKDCEACMISGKGPLTRRVINGLIVLDNQVSGSPYAVHYWHVIGRSHHYTIKAIVKGDEYIKIADAQVVDILKSLKATK